MSTFGQWQSVYAERGLATFPVRINGRDKIPAVRRWDRIGLPGSSQLARRFADAKAFGFALGARSRTKITVLDCDSSNERILSDAMTRHGQTPLIVRSGSGHFQAWYQHNGEGRHIRPDPGQPIDVLGAGFVVAPPSQGTKSPYQIIAGSLDDVDRLPRLQNFEAPTRTAAKVATPPGLVGVGQRNDALFRYCLKQARSCDDLATLLDVARSFVEGQCEHVPGNPVADIEIVKAAASAWRITERGDNRYSDHAATIPLGVANRFISFPAFLGFLTWLRATNGDNSIFMIADGLAPKISFSLPLLRKCRTLALSEGIIRQVSRPHSGVAGSYCWADGLAKSQGLICPNAGEAKEEGKSVSEDSLSISVGLGQLAAVRPNSGDGAAIHCSVWAE